MSEIINHKMRIALLCVVMGMFAISPEAIAQSPKQLEKAADQAFMRKDYYSASQLYAALLYDSPLTALPRTTLYPFQSRQTYKGVKLEPAKKNALTFKLAEAYRLYNRPKDAAVQYEKYIASKDTRNPAAQLWYGYALLATNEPEKATTAFNQYLKTNRSKDANANKAREGIASAGFVIAARQQQPSAEVTRLRATSPQDGSDFAFEKVNDSLFWFTTSRHEVDKKGEKHYPIRLYAGNLNNESVARPVLIPGELNVATPSLSSDRLTMYFTGWKTNARTGQPDVYQLYYITRSAIDSPWQRPVKLGAAVNVPGYNAKQPYVTRDNQYLFFASDQPGGAGKFDIWMAKIDGKEAVGKAIRLDSINTPGDDVTPFYDEASRKLYFSSDGRVGMGGLDIFSADGDPAQNRWTAINNPGPPLNSVRDDQYYRIDATSQTAYLSSDRASSCCLEIFRAVPVKYTDTVAQQPIVKTVTKEVALVTKPIIAETTDERNKRILDSINAITLERTYIHYDYASSKIRAADKPQLETIVQQLKENPDLNIVVASFTDCNGTPAGNERVARARSQSVKTYLIARGISPSRINTDFFSRKHFVLPCIPDKSFDKKAQMANRRSDLILTRERSPRWRPLGNELDLDPSQINPLFRTVNTNFDPRALVVANGDDKTARGTSTAQETVKTTGNTESLSAAMNTRSAAKTGETSKYAGSDAGGASSVKTSDEKSAVKNTAGNSVEDKHAGAVSSANANERGAADAGKVAGGPNAGDATSTRTNKATVSKSAGGSAYGKASGSSNTRGKASQTATDAKEKLVGSNVLRSGTAMTSGAAETNAANLRRATINTTAAAKERSSAPPPMLDINTMLDFTPRVKTGVVAEMTKRIPRQPLYVYSTSDSVRVDLYDNGVFDRDSVSVIFNKQLVAYKEMLQTNKPISFYVKLSTDPAKNEMIFFAENLGLTPPNSALMVITDGNNRRTEVNVASDLEHNTVIYFIKVKK